MTAALDLQACVVDGSNANSLDIVIPLAHAGEEEIQSLAEFYTDILDTLNDSHIRLILSVNEHSLKAKIDKILSQRDNIISVCAPDFTRNGFNNKSNNVSYAIDCSTAASVLLIDDDALISPEGVLAARDALKEYGFVRLLSDYRSPDLFDEIDLFSIFFINAVCEDRQFWGNIGFQSKYIREGRYRKDALFDELAIYRSCKWQNARDAYITQPTVTMKNRTRSLPKFLEQRVRYSYENFAYPCRTTFFLSLFPMASATAFVAPLLTVGLIGLLVCICAFIAETGRRKFGGQKLRAILFCAAVYLAINSVTAWLAVVARLQGGVRFGPNLIRKAI